MKLTILLIVLLLLPIVAFGIDDNLGPIAFSPTVYDARAAAMGRTDIMTGCRSNAIFYNPANLAMIDVRTLQGGGRVWFGTIDNELWDQIGGQDVEASYRLHPKVTHLSYAGYFRPSGTELRVVFGVGYNSYFDFGAAAKREETMRLPIPDGVRTVTEDTRTRGGLNTITPALAVNIDDEFFFGFAFSKSLIGKISKKIEYTYDYEPPGNYLLEEEWEATGSATFITLGATIFFFPELSMGAMYRSGFEFELDDIYEYEERMDGGTVTKVKADSEYEIPAYAGLGASYEFSSKFTLAAEFQTRPYSDMEKSGIEYRWIDDGYCYRIGGELRTSHLDIRGGVFRDAIFAVDDPESDRGCKHLTGVTGGAGFESGNFAFDFFGEYSRWSKEVRMGAQQYDYVEKHFRFGATATLVIP